MPSCYRTPASSKRSLPREKVSEGSQDGSDPEQEESFLDTKAVFVFWLLKFGS
jgi:hypothetical protein